MSIAELEFLVVEDDKQVARVIARTLQKYGSTRIAHTLATAESFFDRVGGFAGVVLDVKLPDGDGTKYLRRLRAAGHDIEVLVLTGSPSADAINTAADLGAVFRIKTSQLVTFIQQFAERARALAPRRQEAADLAELRARCNLTEQHVKILRLALDQTPTARIAELLHISSATVRLHNRHILARTGHRTIRDLCHALRTGTLKHPF